MIKAIIVINGSPGSGKDTLVKHITNLWGASAVENIHTSTPMKVAFRTMGWDGEKTPEIRDKMAEMMEWAQDTFGTSYNHVWQRVQVAKEKNDCIVFIHAREPKNIQHYVDVYGAIPILVKRKGNVVQSKNKSDMGVEEYQKYKYTIENNGTEVDLIDTAVNFIHWVGKQEGWNHE